MFLLHKAKFLHPCIYWCITLLCLLFSQQAIANTPDAYKGRSFWLGYLQSEMGTDKFELSLHVTSSVNASVTVKLAGVSADSRGEKDWVQTFQVNAGSVTNIIIPEEYTFKSKEGKSTNKGLYIEADADVMIVAKNSSGASSDAAVVIPIKSLGTEYYIMHYAAVKKGYPAQYLVMATEDSTVVELRNTDKNSDKQPTNQTYTITLNKGEYHIVQSEKDLTGSYIKAVNGKKLAVFAGNTCAYVPRYCQSCDHLFEQLLPVQSWGHQFAAVPFDTREKYVVRIMAQENNTWVDVDGERKEITKAGKFIELELKEPVYITSSRNIMVCQYTIGSRCDNQRGDPSYVVLKPLLGYNGETVLPIMNTEHINRYYVTVLFKMGDIDKLTVNGKTVTGSYKLLPYTSQYGYAHIELTENTNTIECDCNYNFLSYGFGWYESYAY